MTNVGILPFYMNINEQNHRKDFAFGRSFPLISNGGAFLPFQIVRTTSAYVIESVLLYRKDGTFVADLTLDFVSAGLEIKAKTSYDIIFYPGAMLIATEVPLGEHYLRIQDTGEWVWYSEVFTIINANENSRFLKIQYWNSTNFMYDGGEIDYTFPYRSTVYIDTQLGRPDYPFTETADERDGYLFIESQISKKVFKFIFTAPEYLIDAMRLIRMHDHIRITNVKVPDDPDYHGKIYDVSYFLITPKWLDNGDLAEVQAEFETGTVVKQLGKATPLTELGDFDIDYNSDYHN